MLFRTESEWPCKVWEKETGGLIATAVHTKIPVLSPAKL